MAPDPGLFLPPVIGLLITRTRRQFALGAAWLLLFWLNAWWLLSLLDVRLPENETTAPLFWPQSPSLMAVGHLVVILLFLYAFRVFSPRQGSTAYTAHQAAMRGDHMAAGELWLEVGKPRRAMRAFTRARAFDRAAEVARSLGLVRRAALLLQRQGDESLAGAAQLYTRLGEGERAQTLWLKQGQQQVEHGQPELAIEPFLRAADSRRAAHAAELAFETGRITPTLAEAAVRAAREGKRPSLAARIALANGRYRDAGDLFLAAEQPVDAARAFEKAGDMLRAAEALRLAGLTDEAARLRARHLESSGKFQLAVREYENSGMVAEAASVLAAAGSYEEAIARFLQAGQVRDAAQIARDHGDPAKAAKLFAELSDWEEAGEAWRRAGQPLEAARCFERAADYSRALDLLAQAGRAADQAQLLARLGRVEDAFLLLLNNADMRGSWELLSAYGGTFPYLAPQLVKLATWLEANGNLSEAISAVQRATAGQAVSRELLPALYTLARLLEAHGDLRAAEGTWQKIVEYDFAYADAADRLKALAQRRTEGEAPEARRPAKGEPGEDVFTDPSMRYVLGDLIGRGGMGAVYQARDTRLGRTVAIKILNPRQHTPEALRRFEREARAAAALSHPGIVHVYDFDRGFDSLFIAMELVEGPTLSQLLREELGFVRGHVLLLARQAADAVGYAHEHHVVHRDLKPANMVYANRRQVKILDFGIARRLDEMDGAVSGATGTPFYMAPEQILGDDPDERSDVYSLGITLFQLATGSLPFPAGNVLRAHLEEPPPDPRALAPQMSPDLAKLILSCLEKDPARRPRNGSELFQTLVSLEDHPL